MGPESKEKIKKITQYRKMVPESQDFDYRKTRSRLGLTRGETLYVNENRFSVRQYGNRWNIYDHALMKKVLKEDQDKIYQYGLPCGESLYILGVSDGKYQIFDHHGTPCSPRFKHIGKEGVVQNESIYYIATNDDGKQQLLRIDYNIDNPSLVAKTEDKWERISPSSGLLRGTSKYCDCYDGGSWYRFPEYGSTPTDTWVEHISKYYIDEDTRGNPIRNKKTDVVMSNEKFRPFHTDGLISGKTDYYVATDFRYFYLFHIDSKTPIGVPWKNIVDVGLLEGKSNYIMVQNMEDKYMIIDVGKPYRPISNGWDDIDYEHGLLNGDSDYYIVTHHCSQAIFHKDSPKTPISEWFQKIATDCGFVVMRKMEYALGMNGACKKIFHKNYLTNPESVPVHKDNEIFQLLYNKPATVNGDMYSKKGER